MKPGWLLKTRSPSSFIRRNASRASSELRSMFHLPMVQRRYVTTPPSLLLSYGHHDNRSLEGGASSEMAYFGEGSHRDDPIHPTSGKKCSRKLDLWPINGQIANLYARVSIIPQMLHFLFAITLVPVSSPRKV